MMKITKGASARLPLVIIGIAAVVVAIIAYALASVGPGDVGARGPSPTESGSASSPARIIEYRYQCDALCECNRRSSNSPQASGGGVHDEGVQWESCAATKQELAADADEACQRACRAKGFDSGSLDTYEGYECTKIGRC